MDRRNLNRLLTSYIMLGVGIVLYAIIKIAQQEVTTSRYQARYLSDIARQLSFKLNPGPSKSIRFPGYGPYDQRLGYTLIPGTISRLEKAGFSITS